MNRLFFLSLVFALSFVLVYGYVMVTSIIKFLAKRFRGAKFRKPYLTHYKGNLRQRTA